MERLTERSLDYCTQLCSDEDAISCAFYKGEQEEKCWRANMYDRLASYEDTGLEPKEVKEITSWSYGPFHKKMGDWLKAEHEGHLLVLPCKVGDTLYVVGYCGEIYTHRDWETGAQECPFEGDCELEECDDNTLRVFETTCDGFVLDKLDKKLHITLKSIGLDSGDVLGERVFLTRAEADTAMKGASEDA